MVESEVKNGLYIDYREKHLIDCLKGQIDYKTENMNIGDIIFYKENVIKLLIERKTISDLANSIKDGRLKDQTSRILEAVCPEKCIFLIEGSMFINNTGTISGIPTKSLYTSLFNKLFREKVKLMNSCNINETAFIIQQLHDKFINNKCPFNLITSTENIVETIHIKPRKKGDITEECCCIQILCQIPGISNIKAKVISEKYKSISNFINIINTSNEPLVLISNIKLSNGNHLGIKSAQKIIKYLGIIVKNN